MTVKTFSAAAFVTGALLLGFGTSGAMAAPATVGHSAVRVADVTQAQPAAATEEDVPATCSKSRKRLWVEGEGWIVRRVTTCH